MNEVKLVGVLQQAVESSAPTLPLTQVWVQVLDSQTPKTEPVVRQKLLETIRSEPDLRPFDDRLQQRLNSARRISYERLVDWLVLRGRSVGPLQAVQDLNRYLREDQIPVIEVAAIIGLAVVESEVDLGGGIHLVPFGQLPDSPEKTALLLEQTGLFTHISPTISAAGIERRQSGPVLGTQIEDHGPASSRDARAARGAASRATTSSSAPR